MCMYVWVLGMIDVYMYPIITSANVKPYSTLYGQCAHRFLRLFTFSILPHPTSTYRCVYVGEE